MLSPQDLPIEASPESGACIRGWQATEGSGGQGFGLSELQVECARAKKLTGADALDAVGLAAQKLGRQSGL